MNWIAMIPSMIQGVTGLAQMFSGLANQPKRPGYEPPKAAEDALRASKSLASQTKLPGQQIFETELGEKTANATKSLERMGAGGAGIAGVAALYGKEANARRGLAGQAAQYYMGNQGQLRSQLNQYGQYQDKAWQKNIGDKYQEEAAASSALTQSGMTNAFNAVSNIAGSEAYGSLNKSGDANSGGFASILSGNGGAKTAPVGPGGTAPRLASDPVDTNQMDWVKMYMDLYGNGLKRYRTQYTN